MKIQYVFVCIVDICMGGGGGGGWVNVPCCFGSIFRARIFELLTPHIDSTESIPWWEINFVVKWFLRDIDSMWRYWRFQNSRRHMLCVVDTIIYSMPICWVRQIYVFWRIGFMIHHYSSLNYASIIKPDIFEASILDECQLWIWFFVKLGSG